MTIIKIKTKELLTFYSGCHGNWVTIATMYVTDAYCPIPNTSSIKFTELKELLSFHSGCHGSKVCN